MTKILKFLLKKCILYPKDTIFSQNPKTYKIITVNRVNTTNHNIITIKEINKYLENTVEAAIINNNMDEITLLLLIFPFSFILLAVSLFSNEYKKDSNYHNSTNNYY